MNILIDTQAIPFNRLIIAQAIAEKMPIVSSDEVFDAYSVSRIW